MRPTRDGRWFPRRTSARRDGERTSAAIWHARLPYCYTKYNGHCLLSQNTGNLIRNAHCNTTSHESFFCKFNSDLKFSPIVLFLRRPAARGTRAVPNPGNIEARLRVGSRGRIALVLVTWCDDMRGVTRTSARRVRRY